MSSDLISRIEAATGPDRALDAEIAVAVGVVPEGAFRPCAALDPGTFATGAYTFWVAPRYTESVDAALTLVPENMLWRVGLNKEPSKGESEGAFLARVGDSRFYYAATAALAMCAAALKARDGEKL